MDYYQESDIITLNQKYEINLKKVIGKGSYGVVYECRDLSNPNSDQKLCAKFTEIIQNQKYSREYQIMCILKTEAKGNPNIIQVIDVLVHDEKYVIIQERCECDLFHIIKQRRINKKRFTPKEALEIIKQISYGYKALFDKKIIHRDLKPSNILFLNGTYKIADFGFARVADPYGEHTKLGTRGYFAPEIAWSFSYTCQADIFSLGVIFYQLIFDDLLFKADTYAEAKNQLFSLKEHPFKVSRESLEFQVDDSIPQLIERMVLYSEEDRINWNQFFQHKLIQQSLPMNLDKRMPTPDTENEQEPIKEKSQSLKHNIQPINQPQISKPNEIAQQQYIVQPPNTFQNHYNQQEYINLLCQHYQIGIFIVQVEQEVCNTFQNILNIIKIRNNLIQMPTYWFLHLRRILCNLALIFLNSAKNGQLPFFNLKQDIENFFIKQQNLKQEFQANNLQYFEENLGFQNLNKFIQDIKQFMILLDLIQQTKNIHYFQYQRLIYTLHKLSEANDKNLYYTILKTSQEHNDENLIKQIYQ
ncbi:unnamed protein product [Paramecium octaurelia]|uniref:Protein kinase domain-containing protein n=1 Tax=Paramecium octaurelia TaxID=43137 RepID=A0A8S1X079_PAROT|nr:unnamed protein product [Paramecium octaurelia]